MAELTTSTSACCPPQARATCCEPSEKDACCTTGASGASGASCGCIAGKQAESTSEYAATLLTDSVHEHAGPTVVGLLKPKEAVL